MRSSGELVARASEMLGVQPGKTENRTAFLQRLVYTITGLMGYASLWDMPEDGTDISITHFKQRIYRTLESYLAVYPELQSTFNVTDDTLYEEIYQVFRLTGCLYHTPYRIAPPAASAAAEGAIVFTRGMGLSDIGNVSGLGTYRKNSEEKTNYSVTEMFALNPPLREIWNQWIRSASWSADNLPEMREYLRTCPPFSYSYWRRELERKEGITLLRCGQPGKRQYYLFRAGTGRGEISVIPQWLTDEMGWRVLACAILAHGGCLPATVYRRDGHVVFLKLGYLYARQELNFLKLYSWPLSVTDLPHDFSRAINADVFDALRIILEQRGYLFTEE